MIASVAIVGRANVGKSSLFNALCGERAAIVDPTPGVTRDRIAREIRLGERTVELVDTGGVGMESAEEIVADVEMQIEIAITEANVVLLVLDAARGLQPMDRAIARRLRQADKRVLLVANKSDAPRGEQTALEFYELGLGEPLLTSATHGRGLRDLKDRVREALPAEDEEAPARPPQPLKIAIVGRRNVGKSTLINCLAKRPRVVVSELPGTTRDSVDVRFRFGEGEALRDFIAIDTAGVRKRKQLSESVDYYSQVRTNETIQRADVVVQMIDATKDITKVDKQLADQIVSSYNPCVLALNKMDLVPEDVTDEQFADYVWDEMPGLRFAPLVFMSAMEADNVPPLLDVVRRVHEEAGVRVKTSEVNDVMQEITGRRHPPSRTSRPAKLLYATQVGVHPPTIALFVNDQAHVTPAYERYLANQLRERLPFQHIPIRFVTRRREHAVDSADEGGRS